MNLSTRQELETEIDAGDLFRAIAENSPDAIFVVDMRGRFTYYSPAAERLGYKPDEFVGKNFIDFLSEPAITKASQNFTSVARGESVKGLELQIRKKDGTLASVEVDGSPIINGGRVVAVEGIIRDITERKKMEEELRQSEERFRAIAESCPDTIFLADVWGSFSYCSPTVQRFGYKPDDLVGKNIKDFLPESEVANASQRLIRVSKGEMKIIRGAQHLIKNKDSTLSYVEVDGAPLIKERW
jgi:PAS domain S-box-containing protein